MKAHLVTYEVTVRVLVPDHIEDEDELDRYIIEHGFRRAQNAMESNGAWDSFVSHRPDTELPYGALIEERIN